MNRFNCRFSFCFYSFFCCFRPLFRFRWGFPCRCFGCSRQYLGFWRRQVVGHIIVGFRSHLRFLFRQRRCGLFLCCHFNFGSFLPVAVSAAFRFWFVFRRVVFGRGQWESLGSIVRSCQAGLFRFLVDDFVFRLFVVGRVVSLVRCQTWCACLFLFQYRCFRLVFRSFPFLFLVQRLFYFVDFRQGKRLFRLHGGAFFLGPEDAVVDGSITSHEGEHLLGGQLLALLFGASVASSHNDAFE